ncbi:MAG: hypothetical protein AB1758_16045 [Candidatus Eremiobacterota bacterium]
MKMRIEESPAARVDRVVLGELRRAGLTGVLSTLGVVAALKLRRSPVHLFRQGWRLVADRLDDLPRHRRYALGEPPDLGQILTLDLENRVATLQTFGLSRTHQIRIGLDDGAILETTGGGRP